jgi:hypothetical protein
MNKVFIILYSGSNSEAIEQAVKSYPSWFHFSKDSFLISSTSTSSEIKTQIEGKMLQGKDKLLVLEANIDNVQGWLLDTEWDWLKKNKV